METSASSSNERRVLESMEESWFSQFRNAPNPWMARYVYGLMFLITNLLAWAVRDYGHSALREMERLKGCEGERDCLGAEGVLRVSFGCFLELSLNTTLDILCANVFFNGWHLEIAYAKRIVAFWMVVCQDSPLDWLDYDPLCSPCFLYSALRDDCTFWCRVSLIPVINSCLQIMVFLLIQLISIISFITWLNDCCQSDKNADRCHIHVMLLATTAYFVCIVGIILMYIWYAPEPSCLLNIFFITWTLVLLQLMTSVSLHPKVNAGFLTPGLMGLYVVFSCWCAIRSEPPEDTCNKKAEAAAKADWLTIISFIIAVLAIVIATFSTGIDSKCFQFRKDDKQAEDEVPYGYGFFHFVFATGAMYFAMLLIGWNTHHSMKKWTIDVGWTSTWVRIVNEWLAACVYIWMVVSSLVWENRGAVGST